MSAADAARLARIARLRSRLADAEVRLLAQHTAGLAAIQALEARLAEMVAADAEAGAPHFAFTNGIPAWELDNALAARLRLQLATAGLAARRAQAERQWSDAQSATVLARATAHAAASLASGRASAAEQAEERRAQEDGPVLARPLQGHCRAQRTTPRREH
jgi:hypothetical protein